VVCFFKAVHRYPGVPPGPKSGGSLPWLGKKTYATGGFMSWPLPAAIRAGAADAGTVSG